FSAIIIVVGVGAFYTEGRKMYDIEFVSGTSVQFELKEEAAQPEILELVSKAEYEKVLPAVQVVAVGNRPKEKEFEVVTPNENANQVRDALMHALQGRINIEPPSKFEGVDSQLEQAMLANVIRPADEAIANAYPWARAAIQSHTGGVVFILDNIDPPLTAKEIGERIEH